MTSNKVRIAAAIVGVAATTALVAGISNASNYPADKNENKFQENRLSEDQRSAVDVVFESGDYSAWQEIVGDRPMTKEVTKDNFAQFAEAHKLMRTGDVDSAKIIFDELGIKGPQKFNGRQGCGLGMGMLNMDIGDRQAVRQAIEASDYQAFKATMSSLSDKFNNISEEEFAGLVERHEQRPEMRKSR